MSSVEYDYQTVSTFEIDSRKEKFSRMEEGNKLRTFLAAVFVNFASLAIGSTLGWTSPMNSKIDKGESPLSSIPTKDESSWIGSLLALGALFAPFIAGPLADRIGRKWTLLSSSIFFIISWILLATTKSVAQVYVARILQGFGVGFVMTVQPMYIGEISTDDTRGALGSFMQLFIVTGILYVYAIGPYVNYIPFQIICLILPIAFVATYYFMPESPYYYVGKGNKIEAEKSLMFLRGKSSEGVQHELSEIEQTMEESMRNKASFFDIFKSKGNMKALTICVGLISFQQLSGINVILFYTQGIFQKTGSSLDPAIATILVGAVQVLASGCTPLLADRLGRRIILLVSASVMAIAHGTMGLYFYLDTYNTETAKTITWLPVASLIVFVIVYCIGFGPLPWAVLGEMFPANIKSIASTIVASTCWALGFVVTRWFSALDEAVGSHWAFWIFGIFCAVAFVFTFTVVMETKGLTLMQIQNKLNGK